MLLKGSDLILICVITNATATNKIGTYEIFDAKYPDALPYFPVHAEKNVAGFYCNAIMRKTRWDRNLREPSWLQTFVPQHGGLAPPAPWWKHQQSASKAINRNRCTTCRCYQLSSRHK